MKNKWDTPTLDSNGKQLKMYTQWGAMMLRSRFQTYAAGTAEGISDYYQ